MLKMNREHSCENKQEEPLYRIGMFAQMNHVTIKTLRFYEEKGLLFPERVDEENGYRYYRMGQMAELHRILSLKEAGFTLEDIKALNGCSNEKEFLIRKKNEIMKKIAELTMKMVKIDGYISGVKSVFSPPVQIKKIPAAICATTESQIESYDDLFDRMPEMGT